MDVGHPQAQSSIAGARQAGARRIGNELEKHAIDIETSDVIPRSEAKSQNVSIKRNGSLHVGYVVIDSIKSKLKMLVGHRVNLPSEVSS